MDWDSIGGAISGGDDAFYPNGRPFGARPVQDSLLFALQMLPWLARGKMQQPQQNPWDALNPKQGQF